MNFTSEDIKDMLVDDSSLGLTFATDLFISKEPAGIDDTVTIYDMMGLPPDSTNDRSVKYYRPSIQIRIKNNSYQVGMALAYDIMDSLHNRAQEEWNGTLYTVIQAMGEPALSHWDENDRAIIFINFNCQRR
jgi:hypothetical protein